ncbi:major facilitator superfamily domain-containing protein [Amylocarpus encephaloides]|uniref:Major facilitator superfamily domain-containing protein n=1 Tax=Amylocarpus encephaloides TaxID=45428 RepID=A0A9P8C7W7_9HELO|nr:major facilitator superfamily domain-containing protein [Amylocarpus encephaloides]
MTFACFVFTCFMFAAATAKDFQTLMLARFFAGVFASCPLTIVGGAFADMFGNETRGIAIAAFSALVFVRPFLSPIIGAFITESYLGWRWTEYITGIMGAFALVLDLVFLDETYMKTILKKRAGHNRQETQNFAIHHISEEEAIDFQDLLHSHLLVPLKLLFREPIVFLISIYTAFIYGILYLFLEAYCVTMIRRRPGNECRKRLTYTRALNLALLSTRISMGFPSLNSELRGIKPSIATLPYLGLIVGVLIGCSIVIALEPRYNHKLKENGGFPVPEQDYSP